MCGEVGGIIGGTVMVEHRETHLGAEYVCIAKLRLSECSLVYEEQGWKIGAALPE